MQGGRGVPLGVRRPLLWLSVAAFIVLAADQVSKAVVRTSVGLNESITVIPGVLDVVHIQNTGAAFGMLPGKRILFIAISVTMLAAVAVYWARERPRQWPVVLPLGIVVGGAIGNLWDRAFSDGRVTDFLSFSFFAPVYNLADSAIVVGVIVLVFWVLFGTPGAGYRVAEGAQEQALGRPASPDDDDAEDRPGESAEESTP